MEWGGCILFAGAVDIITTVCVYIGRNLSLNTLANAMYIPAVLSLVFVDDKLQFIWDMLGFTKVYASVLWSVVAIAMVYVIVYGCVMLNLTLGWAKKVPRVEPNNTEVRGVVRNIIGFIRAAGEEIGWRCYLLPCLMNSFRPGTALLISGIAWALFHTGIMILLTSRLNVPRPTLTVIVQSTSCVLSAFPHGWVAIQSGYSLWPSAFMHSVFNVINPKVLGSIYMNTPGEYEGEQWKINGEGLAGCLVMLPLALLITYGYNILLH